MDYEILEITVTDGVISDAAFGTVELFDSDVNAAVAGESVIVFTLGNTGMTAETVVQIEPAPAATPQASVESGEVERGTEVTLTTTTRDATIYYTLDGSSPDSSSTRQAYDGTAIALEEDCTLKTIAVKSGLSSSEVAVYEYTVYVVEVDLSDCEVTLETESYTYDGTAKEPAVTVSYDGTILTADTDYTVSYSSNTNAGTATVTITGKGNYAGTITENYTIAKASQTITAKAASSSIKAGKTTTITASGIGTITYSSSDTSIAKVSSSGKVTGVGVGTATITVKADGNSNYKSATKTVKIKVSLSTPSISSVKQSKTTVTVKWSKIAGAKGYYVYRSTSKSSGYKKIATVTGNTTVSYKDTASKTNGKTYYYKVYAYNGSTKSSASSAKSLKYMKGTVSSLTNTSSGITVKWSKVSGATGYYIYRKASSASKYTLVTTIKGGSTVSKTATVSRTIGSLTKGKTYYVRIRTYKKVSSTKYYSAWSSRRSVKISK